MFDVIGTVDIRFERIVKQVCSIATTQQLWPILEIQHTCRPAVCVVIVLIGGSDILNVYS